MNKLFMLVAVNAALVIFCVHPAAAQWNSGFGIYNTAGGQVGIGTNNPTATLEIANTPNQTFRAGIVGNRANTNIQMAASAAAIADNSSSESLLGAVAWDFFSGANSSWAGTMLFHEGTVRTGSQYGLPTANQGLLLFQYVSNAVIATNVANLYMSPGGNVSTSFLANGNVGIGTTDTKGYKFAVNGDAVFNKVVVKPYGSWPDLVFDSAYKLRPLERVEQYIRDNHHLPEIPSADSVEKNGIDVGANQAALLKKVEELTLYVIEQNKKIDALTEQNKKLDMLEARLKQLEKSNQ